MRILELFAGYGSQALALENLGIDFTSDISEIDKYAIQAYNQLHGETHNWGDINKIDERELPYYDLITYSSPCQDFSTAGKQKGGNKGSGTRSSLLWECERIIRAVKPKFLLMENVKNLLSKKHRHNFNEWFKVLEDMGYTNYYKVLNAKDYGIPQKRERLFCVSILGGGQYLFPNPIPLDKRLKDMLEDNVPENYYLSADKVGRFLQNGNTNPSGKGMNGNVCTGDICNTLTTNKGEGLKIKEVSNTIRGGGGSSLDGKHTWDIVVEPFIIDDTQSFDGVRYYDNYSPALRSERSGLKVVEPRIIQLGNIVNSGNWDNPQRGRIYSPSGISSALNAVGGGGLEPKIIIGPTQKNAYVGSVKDYSPTLTAAMGTGDGQTPMLSNGSRIRKLTPRECFRLMGVKDEQFNRLHGISNSQLYKLAGNSIVVDVLMAIFKNLFLSDDGTKGQLTLF